MHGTRYNLFVQSYLAVVGTVLSCFFFAATGNSQWYKVPVSGEVSFTLNEFWGVYKAPSNPNLFLGDATVTIADSNGQQTQIPFQESGSAVSEDLAHAGYIEANGTSAWTQVVYLNPGTVFRIISKTAAQAYDPTKPFEGGELGAYVLGRVSNVSTSAAAVNSTGAGLSPSQPPVITAPGGTPSNIHAVIISGLSDPAKVIVSSNVTLTGGIVALGKNGSPPSTSSAWSPGLKIIPDYFLLTGEKIPPVTPNIIDVRIVRQDVTADFPSPSLKPDN
jgi:hypothetical protein